VPHESYHHCCEQRSAASGARLRAAGIAGREYIHVCPAPPFSTSLQTLQVFSVVAGPEKGKMEQEDARATMGLQDALSLLPQEMLIKMVPTTRTILLRRTSKKMRTAVENAKVDVVVVRRRGVKFRNGEGLLDKLNGLNAWCRVTELRLNECELGEGGAQAIAAALRVKNTVTSLNLETNELGEGGGQAIAAALRENHTLTSLVLGYNSLGEGGACQSTGNCCGTARE
jgi:hypothetical protein